MLPRPLCIHKGGSAYHSSLSQVVVQLLLSLYDSHTLSDTLWFCQVDRRRGRAREKKRPGCTHVRLSCCLSAAGGERKGRAGCSFLQVASLFLGQRHNSPRRGERPSLRLSIHNGRKGKYLSRRNGTIYSEVTDYNGEGTLSHQRRESGRGALKRASNPRPMAKTRDKESNQKWTKSGPNPPSPFSLSLSGPD